MQPDEQTTDFVDTSQISTATPTLDATAPSGAAATLYDALTRAILSGDLAPGEKLSEPLLARRFGVSRAPVREAIRRLQERDLVTHVAHQGVRVARPTFEDFVALLEVREAVEGMAARLAATAMSDDEIAALEQLVAEHDRAIERNPAGAYIQDDPERDFHIRIARGSGNPILTSLLCDQFYPRLVLCRRRHRTVPGRGREAWKEHVRITDAIVQRDGELAEILMRRHVRAAKLSLQSSLLDHGCATETK